MAPMPSPQERDAVTFSRDELRRQTRALERAQRAAESANAELLRYLFENAPAERRAGALLGGIDRRGLFRLGGYTVAAAAVLAACGKDEPEQTNVLAVSGEPPVFEALPNQPVDDIVLLRTATSLENTIITIHETLIQNGFIDDPAIIEVLRVFNAHHAAHAAAFADATAAAGGTACTGINQKMYDDIFAPILLTIANSPGSQKEDAKAFAYSMEQLSGATHQQFVATYSQPSLRKSAMSVGAVEGRHAAVLAVLLNPETLVVPAVASAAPVATTAPPTTIESELQTTVASATTSTTIPPATVSNVIVAVPSTFGSLGPIPLTYGEPNAEGVRTTTNLETPSLNSFMYVDEQC
jgi:hypothetical protein